MIVAKNYIYQISKYKKKSLGYNIGHAIVNFEILEKEINDKVLSTPFNFEDVLVEKYKKLNETTTEINAINKKLKEFEEFGYITNSNILEIFKRKLDLLYNQAQLKYVLEHMKSHLSFEECELVELMSEIKGHKAKISELFFEMYRLNEKGNLFSEEEKLLNECENNEKSYYNTLHLKQRLYVKKESKYVGLKAKENYLKNVTTDGTENNNKLNETTAEIIAIDEELKKLEEYGEVSNSNILEIRRRKWELLYDQARLEYVVKHIKSDSSKEERELIELMSDIKGIEARSIALDRESYRLKVKMECCYTTYEECELLNECQTAIVQFKDNDAWHSKRRIYAEKESEYLGLKTK